MVLPMVVVKIILMCMGIGRERLEQNLRNNFKKQSVSFPPGLYFFQLCEVLGGLCVLTRTSRVLYSGHDEAQRLRSTV